MTPNPEEIFEAVEEEEIISLLNVYEKVTRCPADEAWPIVVAGMGLGVGFGYNRRKVMEC